MPSCSICWASANNNPVRRFIAFTLAAVSMAAIGSVVCQPLLWLAIASWVGLLTAGVVWLPAGIFIRCQPRRRLPNTVVLTIDDGPDPVLTPALLRLLACHRVSATFFLIGSQAERYPHLVAAIAAAGHAIGSHSYSHAPWLNFYLKRAWLNEIQRAENVLTPYLTARWLRPPFGLMSPHLAAALAETGYQAILFHHRARDFGNRNLNKLAQRLLRGIERGGVFMFHGALPNSDTIACERVLTEIASFLQQIERRRIKVVALQRYLELERQDNDQLSR